MRLFCLVEHEPDGTSDESLRALTFARQVAGDEGDVSAVAFGSLAPAAVATLADHGADEVVTVTAPASGGYAPLAWGRVLAGLAGCEGTAAVVAAASDRGCEVMAHAGALSGLPLAANVTHLERAEPGGWRLGRLRFGGSLVEHAVLATDVALVTVATDSVATGSRPPRRAPAPRSPRLSELVPELGEDDLAVKATEEPAEAGGVSLATARVVVSGGRGVGSPEGFRALEEVAGLLGGAVGVSRAVTSLGWRPHREQVGQTGAKVRPDLYLACGISGAIQHLAGCQSTKVMVALNTDPEAPIMSRADYAVIGDVNEVLPALAEALRARGG